MGACLSCCERWRMGDDSSDSQRLLFEDSYQSHYGTADIGSLPQGTIPQPDPEELKRERDALERLCAQTSDKLVDVSQPLTLLSSATISGSSDTKIPTDYSRLFTEAFPPSHIHTHALRRSRPSSVSTTGYHTPQPVHDQFQDEQAWLKHIMERDPIERRWDWRIVRKIEGDLTFGFDELVRESEEKLNGKTKALD